METNKLNCSSHGLVSGFCEHGGLHWVFVGQLSDSRLVKED